MKSTEPNRIAATILAALAFLIVATANSFAHLKPTEEQIAQMKAEGVYEKRLEVAESMGNTEFSDALFARAKRKLTRASLEAQGLKPEEIEAALPDLAPPSDWRGLPTTGTPKTLTLLIDFADQRAATLYPVITPSAIHSNVYGTGTTAAQNYMPFNSATDFYSRASQGKLNIRGNVLGFYHFPNTQFSYAPLSAEADNQKLFDMVTQAMRSFDATHDFSQYDNDGDGYIEGINVIYVGQRGAWSSFWWGYRWRFYVPATETTLFDGKKLSWFTWQWLGTRANNTDFDPQTLIHETGHLIGLPDLYDYKPGEGLEGGVGGFDVMDGNAGNPNGFLRWMMEWITPEIISGGPPSRRTLRASGDGNDTNQAAVIFPNVTQNPFQEFYMIENRHRTGNDGGLSNLPSNGLAIWHVDATLNAAGTNFAFTNTDRPVTAHKLVKLVQADGLESIETGGRVDAGDYYRTGRSLTPTSSPNSRSYANVNTNISVSNISADGLVMTADIGFLGATGQPDLAGIGSTSLSPNSVAPGGSVNIGGQVTNSGTATAGSFKVKYYLSTNNIISTGDTLLGEKTIASLAAGSSTSINQAVTIPASTQGQQYHIGWILDADATVTESSESNNIVVINDPRLTVSSPSVPNIEVRGAGFIIAAGDNSPRTDDGTAFGGINVTQELAQTFAVANRGSGPLNIASSALSGPNAGDFVITTSPASAVAAGAASSAVVTFRPMSPGPKSATLTINSNDPDTPAYSFALSGSGISNADDHGNTTATATAVNPNSTTNGILEGAGDRDFFRVVIPQTGTLHAFTTGTSDTFGQLISSSGTVIQESDDDGADLNFDLQAVLNAGTYYIRVTGYGDYETGNYVLRTEFTATIVDDHGNTTGTATTAAIGSSRPGTLEVGGDIDMFRVVVPSAGTLEIQTTGNTDTYGTFLDNAGTPVIADDDAGIDLNFSINTDVTAGTYFIAVRGFSSETTGSYVLSVAFTPSGPIDDHGNNEATATVVVLNDTTPGSIETSGDVDYFAIIVPNAGYISIFTTGTTDTFGTLNPLTNDDGGPSLNFEIDAILPGAGTYYLAVRGFDGGSLGDYNLVIHFAETNANDDHWNGPSDNGPTAVQPTSTTAGILDFAGDTDYFVVDVPTAGVLRAETTGSTDTYGVMRNRFGEIVGQDDDGGAGANTRLVQPVTAGIYYIQIEGYALAATGPYSLSLQFTSGSVTDDHGNTTATATAATPGTPVGGVLEVGGDEDFFRFTLAGPRDVTVRTTGTTDTFGTLFNGSGTELALSDDDGVDLNFQINQILPAGTYYVRVRGYDSGVIGAYTLEIDSQVVDDHGDSIADATDATPGTPVAGVLEVGGDEDFFRFTLAARREVVIHTTGATDTFGHLLDSGGAQLAQDDDSGVDLNFEIHRILTPGTYFVRVRGFGTSTGTYALEIISTAVDDHGGSAAVATVATPGTPVTGALEAGGDVDFFRFSIPGPRSVTIRTISSIDTFGHLLDDGENELAVDDDSGANLNFQIKRILPAGTYFVRVRGFNAAATGSYTLEIIAEELPPVIASVTTISPTRLRIAFPTEVGKTYTIQQGPDLNRWSPVPGQINRPGTGNTITYDHPIAPPRSTYLRVIRN